MGPDKRPHWVLGQGWDQVKHKKLKKKHTQKTIKGTEKQENTNTCDLSKVLPSEPQGQGLQIGSQIQGAGPWQLHLLHLTTIYKK